MCWTPTPETPAPGRTTAANWSRRSRCRTPTIRQSPSTDHVRAPDHGEDGGKLLRRVDSGELDSYRDEREFENRPERDDEQAIGPRQHAVHDARLRAVESGA